MTSPLTSIIIVNWNSCDLLKNCLDSIRQTNPNGNYEIIVVDNASTDDSLRMIKNDFPEVVLIENKENLGFAKGCNIGIKASKGKIILFLNSDAEVRELNTLVRVENFFDDHEDVGILGLRLVFPDGGPQASGGEFISVKKLMKHQILFGDSPIFHKLRGKFNRGENTTFYDIDFVSGACFFIRKKLFDEIGIFDESFFMYGEDMDYCFRAKKKGWRIIILPSIKVIHLKSQSTRKNLESALYHGIKNNCFLVYKFYGKNKALIAHSIYSVGLILRFLLAFVRKQEKPMSYLKLFSENIKMQFKLLTS